MDLTKFDKNGNAKDEAVRTRIYNWRNEINFDTWTMFGCLNENLDFKKPCWCETIKVHYGRGDWDEGESEGQLYMTEYECDLPIKQIDICKYLDKDPEELTKEDIEAYAKALDDGYAYEPFCIDHEKDIEELAEEFFEDSEDENKYVHFSSEPID